MTAAKFTLPKSKSAYAMFPPEIQSLIDDAVEAVKDKPWAAAYHAVMDFREMEMASLGPDIPTDSEMETVDRAFRL
ncbi:MAG: hypothetical protein VB959_07105, partial [Rhodospirillales bacterium]